MNADEVRAKLPIIKEEEDGPTGHILLERQEVDGGSATHSVDVDTFVELFGSADLSTPAAALAADKRKFRVNRKTGESHRANPNGAFPANAPAADGSDVVEEEVEMGYGKYLAQWHKEGRLGPRPTPPRGPVTR